MALKRIMSMALAIAVSVGMLVGCGDTKPAAESTTSAGTSTTQASATATQTPEEVELTIWVTQAQQAGVALEREKAFTEKYPYIKLNKVLTPDKMDYQTAYAAGTAPDLANDGMPNITNYMYLGIAQPLDDYLNKWDDYKNMKTEMFDKFVLNGKHYALPLDSYVMVLNYNKKIFAEAGLTPPKTWDELLETAKKLTVPEKGQWGFNLLVSEWTDWWFEYFAWQAGGDVTAENPDGTLKLTFTDPSVQKTIEFYRSLIAAKCIQPDMTLNYGDMQKQFSGGKAAMTLNGSNSLYGYVNQGMNPEDVGYAPLPTGPSGKQITQMGGNAYIITNGISKEKADAAFKWISHYVSKDEIMRTNQEMISKGSVAPLLRVRSDMEELTKLVNPEIQKIVDEGRSYSRLEYYGKGVVSGYLDAAIREAINPKADIMKVFEKQQELAQREAVDNFNKKLLEAAKK
jgi:ABC-type glycerol-3-phosphate transport system substrate-binding protein